MMEYISIGIEDTKELLKYWKEREGKTFRVILHGRERIIKVKKSLSSLGDNFLAIEDALNPEQGIKIIDIKEIQPLEELSAKQIEKLTKRFSVSKAIHFLKKMTLSNGGVLSHEGSPPLPSPSAQTLLALYFWNKEFPQMNIMDEKEIEKRTRWIVRSRMRDWEREAGFNVFAASTCVWACCEVFNSIKSPALKEEIVDFVKNNSSELKRHYINEGGWSWHKDVRPIYPFYTFFAVRALNRSLANSATTDETINRWFEQKKPVIRRFFRNYLKKGQDAGQISMCLWGLYELGTVEKDEKHLAKIDQAIARMEAIPMHTSPIEFQIHFFMPMALIPMMLVNPSSRYTIHALDKVKMWLRENQNEGWGWVNVQGDASWATAWILMLLLSIRKTPEALEALL